jgi:hypothetical protein
MKSEDIENIIKQEIDGRWDLSNAHGVDLKQCLVTPCKQIYFSTNMKEIFELWTVLEETPDKKGYKIYFDELTNNFGLGTVVHKNKLICLGPYGTFLDTLESM